MRISDWSSDVCSSDLNHTAKLNMMAMKKGDEAFFYHSNIGKECVGIMAIAEESFPDPTADKGSPWVVVRVAPVRALAHPVTLAEIKADPKHADMDLIRQSRRTAGHKSELQSLMRNSY